MNANEVAKLSDPNHPVPDPGLEHEERYADVDPGVAARAYRFVVLMFILSPVFALAATVSYFAVPKTWSYEAFGMRGNALHALLGVCSGLSVLLIGIGAVQWARLLMGDREEAEERHEVAPTRAERTAALAQLDQGIAQAGVSRRKLLVSSLGGALGLVALPAIVTLADMGPWPVASTRKTTLEKTIWAEGVRLVSDVTYRPIKASEVVVGQLINAQPETLKDLDHPETAADYKAQKAKASIIIVRMDPASIKVPDARKDWQVDGILSYSKICTHVGCPISLWEKQTHHLLCPCHQSTFDLADSGVVVFGPAARSLPQLPITTDKEGYLVARSDFTVPVGPSYFERDSRNDYKGGN